MRLFGIAAIVALVVFVAGCASEPETTYVDPGEVRIYGPEFTSYDMQQCAATMVDSLLADNALGRRIKEQFPSSRPVVEIMPVANKTLRIFDLKPMTDAIESRLVRAGRFEISRRDKRGVLIDTMVEDMDSPFTSEGDGAKLQSHVVSDYILTGTLVEERNISGRDFDTYYKLTMELVNRRNGLVDWSGEKELRKITRRALIGK